MSQEKTKTITRCIIGFEKIENGKFVIFFNVLAARKRGLDKMGKETLSNKTPCILENAHLKRSIYTTEKYWVRTP